MIKYSMNCVRPRHLIVIELLQIFTNYYFCFVGRGNNTHAYTHSVSDDHHVFLNLQSLRFYCLPDNYEIIGN